MKQIKVLELSEDDSIKSGNYEWLTVHHKEQKIGLRNGLTTQKSAELSKRSARSFVSTTLKI